MTRPLAEPTTSQLEDSKLFSSFDFNKASADRTDGRREKEIETLRIWKLHSFHGHIQVVLFQLEEKTYTKYESILVMGADALVCTQPW